MHLVSYSYSCLFTFWSYPSLLASSIYLIAFYSCNNYITSIQEWIMGREPHDPLDPTVRVAMPVCQWWSSTQTICIKSVLERVPKYCMLVVCLCCEMVVPQYIVDMRQVLYKYVYNVMILCHDNWVATSTLEY